MGYKLLKKKLLFWKLVIVEQNDGLFFTLGIGRCEGVGE